MQIDADPQEDQQNAPDTNYVVENPTLVRFAYAYYVLRYIYMEYVLRLQVRSSLTEPLSRQIVSFLP